MSQQELFLRAVRHFEGGELAPAEMICRDLVRENPGLGDAWTVLAVIAYRQQRYDDAVHLMQQGIRAHPDVASYYANLGVFQKHQGNIAAAIESYRRASELDPKAVDVHFNLGNLFKDQQQYQQALDSYRRAAELDPRAVHVWHNVGNVWREVGNTTEAARCYRQALAIDPDHHDSYMGLGHVLGQSRQYAEAEQCFRRILVAHPQVPEVISNVGVMLHKQRRYAEAAQAHREALALRPEFVEALLGLGEVYLDLKDFSQAEALYLRAAELAPGRASVWYYLGVLRDVQGHWSEALAFFQRAMQLDPRDADIHNDLGHLHKQLGQYAEAEAAYQQAIRLNPRHVPALLNLGTHLQDLREFEKARICYNQALAVDAGRFEVLHNLGNLAMMQHERADAARWFAQAWQVNRQSWSTLASLIHQQLHLCDWHDLAPRTRLLIENAAQKDLPRESIAIPPFNFITLPVVTTPDQQQICTARWVEQRCTKYLAPYKPGNTPRRERRLHIGYLSADFHEHATAYLIAELFEKHDRQQFCLSAYSLGLPDESPIRQRMVKAVDHFIDLRSIFTEKRSRAYEECARIIRDDHVDILVELKGYTYDCVPQIAAQRPAPVQVNYLGYPGTMAASFIDYILVDDFIVPPSEQPFFSEKLVHLPGCYQVNDSQRPIAGRTPSRAECGLPDRGFVFCSFNNSYKITPEMFSVWMRLLRAVPGSVLWLLEGNSFVVANLQREARERDVDPTRLVFTPRMKLPEHLARYRLADLFLDTFPVNAHTTASDALWVGLPLLTVAGPTFISRVAGSLLRAIGLTELITTSLAEYEAMALRLAREPALLQSLRERLHAGRERSGLFDAGRFARNLEAALMQMWNRHQSGQPPQSFTVQSLQ